MSETLNLMPGSLEADGTAPGRRLAEARRAQNLTAADVARQLKLSVWQVEALEAGRYQKLPGPIFVRGFIRNYARLVKLDAGELLRAAGDSLPQAVPGRESPPSQDIPFPGEARPQWPLYAVGAVVVAVALAIYDFYWDEREPAIARPAEVVSSAAPSSPRKVEQAASAAVSGAQVPAPRDADSKPAAVPESPAPVVMAAAVSAPADSERPVRPGERQVRLDFDDESWVEIRDRNERIIFSQLNRPGTQQLVHGLPPFSIVVGNAHGVRLTYDDQPVDLSLHTKIDVARLILQ